MMLSILRISISLPPPRKKVIISLLFCAVTVVSSSAAPFVLTSGMISFGIDDYAVDDGMGGTIDRNPFWAGGTNVNIYKEDPVEFSFMGALFTIQLTATNNESGLNARPQAQNADNSLAVGVNSLPNNGDGSDNASKIDESISDAGNTYQEFLSFKIVSQNGRRVRFSDYRLQNYQRDSNDSTFDDAEWRFSDSGTFSDISYNANPNSSLRDLPTLSEYIEFTTGAEIGSSADGYRVRKLGIHVPVGGSTLMMFGSGLLGLAGMRRLARRK